jgi:hypothetical protein
VQEELARRIEELERELRSKEGELASSLLREMATADVLRIISGWVTDVQAVLDAILASSKRLLHAHTAVVTRLVGDDLQLAAFTAVSPEADEEAQRIYPLPLDRKGAVVLAVRERRLCAEHFRSQRFKDLDPRDAEGVQARPRAVSG